MSCTNCGQASHTAAECPSGRPTRVWSDCTECGRPGHVLAGVIGRNGSWTCRDCRDPAWRSRLGTADPRYRRPGDPLQRTYDSPARKVPLVSEPQCLRHANVDDLAGELRRLREPAPKRTGPRSPEEEAALRELAARQVAHARKDRGERPAP